MKSLGILTVLATVIVVGSAQNQIAEINAEAIAEAFKGARVIHVPAGSTIYHKPPQGARPAPNKPAQAATGARATLTAQAGVAKHAPSHPHHGGSHPQPHHPAHNPKHANPSQKQAVATATTQATAVAKTPKKSDGKKLLEPLALLPSELKTLIDAVMAEGPLKAGIDIITGLIDTEKNTVPLIIAGINKDIKDLADMLLSPESVNKAVNTIVGIQDEVAKKVVAKLGDLVRTHTDMIQNLLESLVDVGQLAQAAATGLSVVATLGVILQNEVFSKIATDMSKLPLDKLPIPLDTLPNPLDILLMPLEKHPMPLDKLPIPLEKLPNSLDHVPNSLNKLPMTLSELLSPLNKLLEPLEKELGKKLTVFAGPGSQAVATGSQDGEDTAQASSTLQPAAGGVEVAVANAVSAAVDVAEEEILEDIEDWYGDEEEASAEAAAPAAAVAVAHAG